MSDGYVIYQATDGFRRRFGLSDQARWIRRSLNPRPGEPRYQASADGLGWVEVRPTPLVPTPPVGLTLLSWKDA